MRCDLDWGITGVENAVARGDVIVIADTLSFSSAVVAALEQNVMLFACATRDRAANLAQAEQAQVSVPRTETGPSLSPLSYQDAPEGTRVVLASPNGAACAEAAAEADHAYIGCLRNAETVAVHIAEVASSTDKNICLIAAGERSTDHGLPGEPRLLFAIEDYLACGAMLSAIMADFTAEATVCSNAFMNSQEHLEHLIAQSMSGRQLLESGGEADVDYSSQLNQSSVIPQVRGAAIVPHDAPQHEEQAEETIEESPVQEPTPEAECAEWPTALLTLRDEALQCTKCALAETRTHVVFGEGDPSAKLMLVGEGPGDHEDRTGRPFVGRAGKLLDEALQQVGIRREDIWVANVLKCRACVIENDRVKNRAPKADEIKACRPYLESQIEIIAPSVILCIGAPAANLIIHKSFKMTQERGQWFIDTPYAPNVMAALHPAYILRQHGDPYEAAYQSLVDDLKSAWERSQEEPPAKSQLTLF